jgi:hypothetical protein
MDAKKIYTLVALAAYYNKVLINLLRAIKSVQEPLSNLKEWEQQKKNKDTFK